MTKELANTHIEIINNEINRELASADVGRALLATTFKGLNPTSMKQAIMEGMIRGFKFKDFLEKNVYAIPYGQGYSLVTSIDYARKRGMRAGIVGKDAPKYVEREGEIISCSVTVKRRVDGYVGEYTAEVYLDEYTTGKNLWVNKPRTMLAKVAEMHALRMACPEELSQVYTEEEMESGAMHVESRPAPMEPYQVERKEVIAEDEAGGGGAKVEQRHEEAMEAEAPAITPTQQRMEIFKLLKDKHKFIALNKKEEVIAEKVMNITGISYAAENYAAIIEELEETAPSGIKY